MTKLHPKVATYIHYSSDNQKHLHRERAEKKVWADVNIFYIDKAILFTSLLLKGDQALLEDSLVCNFDVTIGNIHNSPELTKGE